jgi:hypothetical protein
MQEPEKPKEEGLKGLNLDKGGDAVRDAAKKGLSFFKTAKAALQGDEASKQKIADGFSSAAIKANDALHQVEAVAKDTRQKIVDKLEEREKQAKPPQP